MLPRAPQLKRWEQPMMPQNALLRPARQTVTPASLRDFYRRPCRFGGPSTWFGITALKGTGQACAVNRGEFARLPPPLYEGIDSGDEPSRLAIWAEFASRSSVCRTKGDVFDLVWYQGVGHTEAAELLDVSVKTVKRRWQAACLHLHDALHGELPGA